ncbi:MAG: hypothetical protein H0T91_02885 [Propionibacteriaceae bacterium]|nr:hypothetical protein [Propionibacteriaceae bacterium]
MGDPDGEDQRYAVPRARKLGPEQEHAISVAASRGATLRELAALHRLYAPAPMR